MEAGGAFGCGTRQNLAGSFANQAPARLLGRRVAKERPAPRTQLCQALVASSVTLQQLVPTLHVAAVITPSKNASMVWLHTRRKGCANCGRQLTVTGQCRQQKRLTAIWITKPHKAVTPFASSSRELPEPAASRNSDSQRSAHPALILLIDITGGINSHLHDDLHPSAMCGKSSGSNLATFPFRAENPLNLQAEDFSRLPLLT
jgi:hypothetical protein